jgi:multidrug efflux pump subunit AcrA (membrane-fusion protein)
MQSLKAFLRARIVYVVVGIFVVIAVILTVQAQNEVPDWTTDAVTVGAVKNLVSVSGIIDAVESAELAFSVSGTLESVSVKEGDVVTKGQVLATLSHNDLKAEYQDAYGALLVAEADLRELVTGLRPEERDIAKTTAEIAREDLTRITKEQDERVASAYRALLSTDLEARPNDNENDDTPPTISGMYTCGKEGTYTLEMFRSASRSGYSYRLSELETGTYTAYTESSAPLGNCGLAIQFADGATYGNSSWIIEIPNVRSASYVTNWNAYTLALTQKENAIREAEQKLTLAEQNETLDTASPRGEALSREEARVLQAQAKLASVRAQIEKQILKAPFDGTVSHIESVPGESVGATPLITMVSDNAFALTALVPEIDVTKVSVGQKADVVFDARQNEILSATIIFISPLARKIDGVSYFEAKLAMDGDIDWLRSGLNADVDIIIETHENVTRIPKRYLVGEEGSYTVLTPDGNTAKSVSVTVTAMGNDGFVGIEGIEAGTTIIAP